MKPFGLGQMKILEDIPADELAPIERFCEEVFYPNDTLLAFDGEEAKYVFLLRKGKTELVARHPKTGKKVVIARKMPGETMGFSSVIQPYQMDFTIEERSGSGCALLRRPPCLRRRPVLRRSNPVRAASSGPEASRLSGRGGQGGLHDKATPRRGLGSE